MINENSNNSNDEVFRLCEQLCECKFKLKGSGQMALHSFYICKK